MDVEGLDVPPPPYVGFSPDEIHDSSSTLSEYVELEPPARSISPPRSPQPSTSEYAPIVYDVENGQKFYGSLIDNNGYPSKIMCRMSDALFFYVNDNCPRADLKRTQFIEPSKLLWLVTAPENEVFDMGPKAVRNLSMIYDAASIPYSLNNSGLPVLDRRGFFHWTTFEARANPDESHPFWNKMMNIFKLVDPLTNIAFPTPLMRSNFPTASVPALDKLRRAWQRIAAFQIQRHQRSLNGQTALLPEPQALLGEGQEWHMDGTQRALNRLALRKEQRQQVWKALKAGSIGQAQDEVISEAPKVQQPPSVPHSSTPPPIPWSSRPVQRGLELLKPFLADLQSHVYPSSPSPSPSQSINPQSRVSSGLSSLNRLGQLRPGEIRKAINQELSRQFGGSTLQPDSTPFSGRSQSTPPPQRTSNNEPILPDLS